MKKQSRLRKTKMSLRLKMALASIVTLCIACCFSCLLVVVGFCLLYQQPITIEVAIVMCLFVCAFTMFFGGMALWHEALYITKPISRISEGVKKISDGDFSVQLEKAQS